LLNGFGKRRLSGKGGVRAKENKGDVLIWNIRRLSGAMILGIRSVDACMGVNTAMHAGLLPVLGCIETNRILRAAFWKDPHFKMGEKFPTRLTSSQLFIPTG
jgi:hypothetical protein